MYACYRKLLTAPPCNISLVRKCITSRCASALKRGYTLSEYALARLDDGAVVAAASEEEIYGALGLDWIPPELRENQGEMEAAAEHRLPRLIETSDLRGDVHMHTQATDGRNTILEMAEAGLARGYQYIAITDHSKNLAMVNGLDGRGFSGDATSSWVGTPDRPWSGKNSRSLHSKDALLQNGAQIFAVATFRYPDNKFFQSCGVDPT
jgi:hypothetical protein